MPCKCTNCHGTGTIETYYGMTDFDSDPCSTCGGTGQILTADEEDIKYRGYVESLRNQILTITCDHNYFNRHMVKALVEILNNQVNVLDNIHSKTVRPCQTP